MTSAIHDNCHTCWNRCPIDAGDKSSRLEPSLADTNGIAFPVKAVVTYIDIITASGKITARSNAQCYVVAARCIIQKRIDAGSRVEVAGCVVSERPTASGGIVAAVCVTTEPTDGRVLDAGGVVLERITADRNVDVTRRIAGKRSVTDGGVVEAASVARKSCTADGGVVDTISVGIKRIKPHAGVVSAGCEANQRIIALDSVVVRQAALLTSRSRLQRNREAGEHQRNEKLTAVEKRRLDRISQW